MPAGDSTQSWRELGYAPPGGYPLQRHGSNVSQEAVPGTQGLIPANPGQLGAGPGPINGSGRPNGVGRHQRWSENPFVNERGPFTPFAESNDMRNVPYGSYQRLPFDNRPESTAGPLVRAGSGLKRQGSGLIRFASGDQHVNGTMSQQASVMMQQASSPGHIGLGMSLYGSGMPWNGSGMEQLWAPMLTAADAAASAGSIVMHGPHSLLEQPGQGECYTGFGAEACLINCTTT